MTEENLQLAGLEEYEEQLLNILNNPEPNRLAAICVNLIQTVQVIEVDLINLKGAVSGLTSICRTLGATDEQIAKAFEQGFSEAAQQYQEYVDEVAKVRESHEQNAATNEATSPTGAGQ